MYRSISDWFDFSIQEDIDAWFAAAERLDFGAPYNSDLRPFQQTGGKVLFWNGVSDPCCSDIETEEFFRRSWEQGRWWHGGFS
ncbi:hypothetical protein RM533_09205 [Croceicoccus sp. F390]|uniref:Uncharacterized protein n=1 Tax=Croceicoccus esteveae TaxID=3075597 RepID=A0ABU2ZJ80_9SPHN|nr:hypothetical protein [Croceicoccus sp. F390]MDT0576364.1 hypothetical protein [Croceicoccus sp. F390]